MSHAITLGSTHNYSFHSAHLWNDKIPRLSRKRAAVPFESLRQETTESKGGPSLPENLSGLPQRSEACFVSIVISHVLLSWQTSGTRFNVKYFYCILTKFFRFFFPTPISFSEFLRTLFSKTVIADQLLKLRYLLFGLCFWRLVQPPCLGNLSLSVDGRHDKLEPTFICCPTILKFRDPKTSHHHQNVLVGRCNLSAHNLPDPR